MRAQVLEEFNKPYVLKTDIAQPQHAAPGDVLIRVLAASYCHTDTVYASGVMAPATLPRVGCHEFAGEICALGEQIPPELKDQLKVGTKVGVPVRAYHPCGNCVECIQTSDIKGYSVFCPKAGRLGVSIDGGFQDYVTVDARQVEPIPSPLTPIETAPLMCAGLTIFAALQRIQAECKIKGTHCDKIAIVGAGGGLGHLGIQFAVKMGFATVVATDTSDAALQVIKDVGMGWTNAEKKKLIVVDARATEASTVLDNFFPCSDGALGGEVGVDAVIILPESQKAFDYGMKLLRRHGICCVVSFPQGGFVVDANDLIFRDIKLAGSLIGTKMQTRDMMQLAAQAGVRAQSRTFALENLNGLVDEYHRGGGGKLVIDMTVPQGKVQ